MCREVSSLGGIALSVAGLVQPPDIHPTPAVHLSNQAPESPWEYNDVEKTMPQLFKRRFRGHTQVG